MPNSTLFAAATEDTQCWEIVMGYVAEDTRDVTVPSSVCGTFDGLPAELRYRIYGELTVKDCVNFAATSRQHRFVATTYLHFQLTVLASDYHLDFARLRFVLLASGSLMSGYPIQSVILGPTLSTDTLDFYTTKEWTEDLLEYLQLDGGYTANTTPILGPIYCVWFLRRGGRLMHNGGQLPSDPQALERQRLVEAAVVAGSLWINSGAAADWGQFKAVIMPEGNIMNIFLVKS
ncbi:hypothetical protein B0H16DRAFT_1474966 [Mycena metata]|uniref:F-box domain-containing protein n=1 Tax=Mycena metata TaxID=1033252 RepID=A0AAD7HF95_9AGAR|nr:hypothetical protein B0H16DRAFT_1474966 [Mycena metata]